MTESEANMIRALYEIAHGLWERLALEHDNPTSIPEWRSFGLLRVPYRTAIDETLAKHSMTIHVNKVTEDGYSLRKPRRIRKIRAKRWQR